MLSRWATLAVFCGWWLGCFPDLPPAGAHDGGATRDDATGSGTFDAEASDVPPYGTCGLPRWVDGARFGEHRGRTTVVAVDRTEAVPVALRPPPPGCEAGAPGAAVVAVRHVASADAWLRVEAGEHREQADHLWVATGCDVGAEVLACEGRLPRTPEGAWAVGPLRTRRPLRHGEVVWIFLASVPGDGELVITEVPEVIPPEGLCDPGEVSGVCALGTSCVASGATTRCVADGREGARCRGDFSCDAPLRCRRGDGAWTTTRCVSAAPAGAWCGDLGGEHPVYCAEGTCVDHQCRRDGSFRGACRRDEPRCDASMVCGEQSPRSTGVCLRRQAAEAPCWDAEQTCPEGEACPFNERSTFCRPRGTLRNACRERGPRCDDGLYCHDGSSFGWRDECVSMPLPPRPCGPGNAGCPSGLSCFTEGDLTWCAPGIPRGQRCYAAHGGCLPGLSCARRVGDGFGQCYEEAPLRPEFWPCGASGRPCPRGWHCFAEMACLEDMPAGGPCPWEGPRCAADLRCQETGVTPNDGTCRAAGAEWGWCRDGVPACDGGLRCFDALEGVCWPTLRVGDPCPRSFPGQPLQPQVCPQGTWCDATMPEARCAAHGAPGGPCRATAAPCDEGLRCDDGVCVTPVESGAVCDALHRCPRGHWCAATDAPGEFRCAAPGDDRGPCRTDGAACDGSARCLVGWTHRLDPALDRLTLIARESFPIAPHCEARPEAPRVVCGSFSVGLFTPQSLCPADRACLDPLRSLTCVPAGARGQPCRLSAPRCDAGLACAQGACADRTAPGGRACGIGIPASLDRPRCTYPQACAFDGHTVSGCADSPILVEVAAGAPVPSACGDPLEPPTEAVPVELFGVAFDVTVNARGDVSAHLRGAGPGAAQFQMATRDGADRVVTFDVTGDYFSGGHCGHVVGQAPRRRVVFMNYTDRVTLHEGTGGVEISYGPETSLERAGAPTVVAPTLLVAVAGGPSYQVIADDVSVTAGTVVRFLPR